MAELPKGISAGVFYDQILKMQKTKEEHEFKLAAIQAQNVGFEAPLDVDEFEKFTQGLRELATKTNDPSVQASICRKLIKRIDIATNGISIHYFVGENHYRGGLGSASFSESRDFFDGGSNSLTSGSEERT